MKIALSAETTIDLSKDLLNKFNISTVPFSVILGSVAKLDGEISNQEIFDYVKNNNQLPKTSAVNQFQYEEHFKKLLKDYDAVIHFALSSEISSAYRNAILAANEFNHKVYVIDSRNLTTGIALEAMYARALVDQGLEPNEIVSKINELIPSVRTSFVIKQLDYLYKGGRCSRLAMFGANIFHICPEIVVKDGKMDTGKKFRGPYLKVINDYIDSVLEAYNIDLENVFITYSSIDQENEIVNTIKTKLITKGFKNIYFTNAGGTIACHCGPNTLGIIYLIKHG